MEVDLWQEMGERLAVCAEARTWLLTPFRDQAAVKGAGVDCAMLAVSVFVACGIVPAFDPRPYPPRWFLHKDEERFLNWVTKFAVTTENALPGNLIVYREGRTFAHCAIVLEDGQNVIHASWGDKAVVMTPIFDVRLTSLPTGKPRPHFIFDAWKKRREDAAP